MSAEILREAAALMRSRAQAATPGPWSFNSSMEDDLHADAAGWIGHSVDEDSFQEYVASTANHPDGFADGAHIASWHPAVALEVAAWLDEAADVASSDSNPTMRLAFTHHALAVARAFLGEATDA